MKDEAKESRSLKKYILMVEDDEEFCDFIKYLLPVAYQVEPVKSDYAALELLRNDKYDFDIVLMDIELLKRGQVNEDDENPKEETGLAHIKRIREEFSFIPIIVISSYQKIDLIVNAIKNGAVDYIWKGGFNPNVFRKKLDLYINTYRKKKIHRRAIWGESPQIQQVKQKLESLAKSAESFFLIGEQGLGQKYIVKYVHYYGDRFFAELLTLNLSDYQEDQGNLLSYLAGEGYRQNNVFKQAKGGVVYLKSIHKLPLSIQEKFSQVFETGCFLDQKTSHGIQFIIDLPQNHRELLDTNTLHKTLYGALPKVQLPPLRERKDDIQVILKEWMQEVDIPLTSPFSQSLLAEAFINALKRYDFPGNSRELSNIIDLGLSTHRNNFGEEYLNHPISWQTLPQYVTNNTEKQNETPHTTLQANEEGKFEMEYAVAQLELSFIEEALHQTNGNKSQAAKLLYKNKDNTLGIIKKYIKKFPDLIGQFPLITKLYNS